MSKKKFKSGLESLFFEDQNEDFKVTVSEKVKSTESNVRSKKRQPKRSKKNFTKDLDSLFGEAFEVSANQDTDTDTNIIPKKARFSRPRRVFGLDSLIQNTSNGDFEVNTPLNKRVSFVFDKKKFTKLKRIAKVENLYLKDIIGDVIIEYINQYESEHGKIK